MTDRISIKTLENMVARLNKMTNSPETYSHRDETGFHAHIGHWTLSQAYGGVCVERVMNEDGGVTCPIWMGHVPKREAYNRLRAFMAGLEYHKYERVE